MGTFCPVDLMRGPAAAPHTELFLTPEPGEAEVSDGKAISEVVSKETDGRASDFAEVAVPKGGKGSGAPSSSCLFYNETKT